MDIKKDFYYLTIIQDRYNGAYSGGKWIVFNMSPSIIYENNYCGFEDDDSNCMDFWRRDDLPLIGRGNTIDEAIQDLWNRYEKDDNYVLTDDGWELKKSANGDFKSTFNKYLSLLDEVYKNK